MDWSTAANIATVLAGLVAVLSAPFATYTYRKSVRAKRAEWLASLHEKFFETDRYSRVRRILDYREEPSYSQLATAVAEGRSDPLAAELFRYLNFFELLASLRDLGEISPTEIKVLFEYDLKALQEHQFIRDALSPEGFERLPELFRLIGQSPAPSA
jgi:hypothetical protein